MKQCRNEIALDKTGKNQKRVGDGRQWAHVMELEYLCETKEESYVLWHIVSCLLYNLSGAFI